MRLSGLLTIIILTGTVLATQVAKSEGQEQSLEGIGEGSASEVNTHSTSTVPCPEEVHCVIGHVCECLVDGNVITTELDLTGDGNPEYRGIYVYNENGSLISSRNGSFESLRSSSESTYTYDESNHRVSEHTRFGTIWVDCIYDPPCPPPHRDCPGRACTPTEPLPD